MTEPKVRNILATPVERPVLFSCEQIAYWFFRLNGCLNLTNFLVHHEKRRREGTEIDVLGVRFPYRNEFALSGNPMKDHIIFDDREKKLDVVIADSKMGRCDLNNTWTNPNLKNIERILLVLGIFPSAMIENVAKDLYTHHFFEDDHARVNFYTLGLTKSTNISPAIIQLEWNEVLSFIHHRFITFEDYKRQHDQWDVTGKELFRLAMYSQEQFMKVIISNLTK